MKMPERACLVLLLVLACAAALQAQPYYKDDPYYKDGPIKSMREPITPDETDPALVHWPWFQEIHGLDKQEAKYYVFVVPPSVFGKAHPQLHDLRLADARGVRIPYVKRELRPRSERIEVPIERRFDEGTNETRRSTEFKLVLGDPGPDGHNAIDIVTSGMNFRRKVEVLGFDSSKFQDGLLFAEGHLVRYELDDGRKLDLHEIRYDAKRFRYLQVRVYADPSGADKGFPKVEAVKVRRSILIPGTYMDWTPASLSPADLVRTERGPGTAWFIDFGEKTPCERLRFTAAGEEVERPMRLEIANPDEPRMDVGPVERRWVKAEGASYLELDFREAIARRLRLVVTDFANAPLNLQSVQYTAPVRQIIFARPQEAALPIRAYFGIPEVVNPPNYDLERKLPLVLDPPATQVRLGPLSSNPAYEPPPLPLSERVPWLVYVVLAIASLALLGILFLLGRKVIARHDAEKAAA